MKRTLLSSLSLALAITACETTRPPTGAPSTAPKTSASAPPAPATAIASGSAQAPTASAPRATGMFDHVYIYDIDWRTGGHALFVRGDGSGISRVAGALKDNVQNEKRYTLSPSAERADKIRAILDAHRASSMKVDPMMAPGDQIAVVRLLPPNGPEVNLRGPAGKNEPFRKLLLDLEKALEAISVSVSGTRPRTKESSTPTGRLPSHRPAQWSRATSSAD